MATIALATERAVSWKKRKARAKREIFRIRRGNTLPGITKLARATFGFDGCYTAEEFTSLLDGYRQQAMMAADPDTFALYYQLAECFSKWEGPGLVSTTDEDRLSAAQTAFWEAEEACRISNLRLAGKLEDVVLPIGTLERAEKLVRAVLGRFPIEELPRACGFGPGASTSLKRANSSQQNKWQNARHITAPALPYYMAFYHWAGLELLPSELEVVDGNNIATVPKNFKTWRTIAIEPDWNSFFQKGIGRLLRRRLQRIGLLERDAQEFHGHLAMIGSQHGELATLDLKAASDTLSYMLIKALLPDDWFQHLVALRSPVAELGPAGNYRYQKFSSMGNGYTFELETLVFWALACAVLPANQRGRVSVYGDDIIMPTSGVEELTNLFTSVGLTLNGKKSFWGSHPFRESCGKHYFRGRDVTPFYIRHELETAGDLVTLANNARTWGLRHGEETVSTLWEKAFRVLPPELRGPLSNPKGALACPWDLSCPDYVTDVQAFRHLVITREHLWRDVWTWSGSYLFKLWVGVGDEFDAVEASYLSNASSREVVGEVFVDACSWE